MIIGLNGFKESGKDTAYQFIEQEFGGDRLVVRRAFADPLKRSVARSLGLLDLDTDEAVEFCNKIKETGRINVVWDEIGPVSGVQIPKALQITGREFLQWFGTEGHRDVFGYNFWVDHALPEFDDMGLKESTVFGTNPKTDLVIFTDCRFPNEAERVKQNGGVVWEILRPDTASDGHASEVPLPRELVDAEIDNVAGLEEFRHEVCYAVESLLGLVQS